MVNIPPSFGVGSSQMISQCLCPNLTGHLDEGLLGFCLLLAQDADHMVVVIEELDIFKIFPYNTLLFENIFFINVN